MRRYVPYQRILHQFFFVTKCIDIAYAFCNKKNQNVTIVTLLQNALYHWGFPQAWLSHQSRCFSPHKNVINRKHYDNNNGWKFGTRLNPLIVFQKWKTWLVRVANHVTSDDRVHGIAEKKLDSGNIFLDIFVNTCQNEWNLKQIPHKICKIQICHAFALKMLIFKDRAEQTIFSPRLGSHTESTIYEKRPYLDCSLSYLLWLISIALKMNTKS